MVNQAVFLAVVNKAIVDYLAAPLKKKFPKVDFWWLVYVALGTGSLVGWYSEINLFWDVMPNEVVGRVLTCVLVGGGSSLIHELFERIVNGS